jgi:TRAP-type uncharacterized transport system fused permease subunit
VTDMIASRGASSADEAPPVGLAAFAGALAGEWDTVDEDMRGIVAARQHVVDRPPPDLS